MGRDDEDIGAVLTDAMHLGHGLHRIREMLDDVRHEDPRKPVALKWPRILIKVPDNVRGRIAGTVDAHRARVLLPGPAPDIENIRPLHHGC